MELAWNTQKNKMTDVKGKEMEQERKGKISNEEIDPEKTKLNYDLVPSEENLYQRVKSRVDDLKASGSRVQKNSVVMYSNILTVSEAQSNIWGEQKTDDYFKSCYEFFCKEFGKENVVSAKVHKDETAPHMHLQFVPVNPETGKLQARVAMNRERINHIHSALPKFLQERGFDVERASGKTKDKNIEDIHEFKAIKKQMAERVAELVVPDPPVKKRKIKNEKTGKGVVVDFVAEKKIAEKREAVKKEIEDTGSPEKYLDKHFVNLQKQLQQEVAGAQKKISKEIESARKEVSEARKELLEIQTDISTLQEEKRELGDSVASERSKTEKELKVIADEGNARKKELQESHELAHRFADMIQAVNDKKISFADIEKMPKEEQWEFINRAYSVEKLSNVMFSEGKKETERNKALLKENEELKEENARLENEVEELRPFKHFVESDKKLGERFKDFVQETYQAVNNFINKPRGRSI